MTLQRYDNTQVCRFADIGILAVLVTVMEWASVTTSDTHLVK